MYSTMQWYYYWFQMITGVVCTQKEILQFPCFIFKRSPNNRPNGISKLARQLANRREKVVDNKNVMIDFFFFFFYFDQHHFLYVFSFLPSNWLGPCFYVVHCLKMFQWVVQMKPDCKKQQKDLSCSHLIVLCHWYDCFDWIE